MKIIIYPTETGIAVIMPVNQKNLAAVALKDVPHGLPFKIVDAATLPAREKRSEFVADFSEPDGYGADFGEGSEWAVVDYDHAGQPKTLIKSVKDGKIQKLDRAQKREISKIESEEISDLTKNTL